MTKRELAERIEVLETAVYTQAVRLSAHEGALRTLLRVVPGAAAALEADAAAALEADMQRRREAH